MREFFSLERISKWVGYPLFFMACLLFFAYLTFPYDRLRDKLVQVAATQGYELEVIELEPSWITGVTLSGVRLVLPAQTEGDPTLDLVVDELTVRASLIPLTLGRRAGSFEAEFANGYAEGDVSFGAEDTHIDAELETIDLKRISALRRYTKIPVEGIVTGQIELDMPKEVNKATGFVELTIEGLSVGDDESQIDVPGWGGLTVDRASLGTLKMHATIADGLAKIDELQSHGKDLKLDATGQVRLSRPLGRSQLDVLARIEIQEAYKERSTRIAAVLDLAKGRPEFKSAQTSDGAIQYRLAGSIAGRIRPKPAGREKFAVKSTGREDKRP